MMNAKELAQKIRSDVEWLVAEDYGCSTIKLDDHLAVCVGWSDGYDPEDDSVIHARNGKTWCINAAVKVWTSDDMRSDLDWINMPYYESGEVWDTTMGISPDEDYEALAEWFLKEYDALKDFEMDRYGMIKEEK